jgi:hypothetical protein
MTKTLFSTLALAAALVGGYEPVQAATLITVAPPPLREEVVPAPRHGHHWVPGYWHWNGHRHVWVHGTWVREREGYRYAEPRWVEEHEGHWRFEPGRWTR